MRESKIEQYLVDELESRNAWPLKYTSSTESGLPDRLCLFPNGKVVWVECKRSGRKTLDPLQKIQVRKLKKINQVVLLINSKAKVDAFIAYAEKEKWFYAF